MSKEKTKRTEISVLYNLPENWAEETAFSFSPIASEILKRHYRTFC